MLLFLEASTTRDALATTLRRWHVAVDVQPLAATLPPAHDLIAHYDLLITDVGLAAQLEDLKHTHRRLPPYIVLSNGLTKQTDIRADEGMALLSRPVRTNHLRRALRDLLLASPDAPKVTTATPAKAGRTAAHVLLVEDNPVNRKVATMMLKRLGYATDTAECGQDAIDAIQTKRYDAILMDLHMPDMDGFQATRTILALDHGDSEPPPIIAFTANAFDEDMEACLAAGMVDHLSKPIQRTKLKAVLERWTASEAAVTA